MKMRRFSRAACWPMNSASDLGRSAASASSTRRVEEISRSSLMRDPQPNRHAELVSASIVPLVLIQRGQTQPNRQIDPPRIFGFDQIDLPLPMPTLELLFPTDGLLHRVAHFETDEIVDGISPGEARNAVRAVLMQASQQVRRHPNIDRAIGLAGEDIDPRRSEERRVGKECVGTC